MAASDERTPPKAPPTPPEAPTTGTTGGSGAPQSRLPDPGGGVDRVPRERPLISDRPAGADVLHVHAPEVDAEATGPALEAAGEAHGFSPMKWIPILLLLILVLVLLFTQM